MVREVIAVGIGLVVLLVAIMIGGAMVAKTENVTLEITDNSTLIQDLADDSGTALTTVTSLVPLLALGAIGGLAIAYLIFYLGRQGSVM